MATAASKRFSAAWPWKLRIKKRLGETGRLPVFCGSAMAAAYTAEEAEEKGSRARCFTGVRKAPRLK